MRNSSNLSIESNTVPVGNATNSQLLSNLSFMPSKKNGEWILIMNCILGNNATNSGNTSFNKSECKCASISSINTTPEIFLKSNTDPS